MQLNTHCFAGWRPRLQVTNQIELKQANSRIKMKHKTFGHGSFVLTVVAALMCTVTPSQAQDKKPNILFIMGDDIGMWNIGAYHRGLMAGRTPNLDKLAKEGMLFTDYYAEAS